MQKDSYYTYLVWSAYMSYLASSEAVMNNDMKQASDTNSSSGGSGSGDSGSGDSGSGDSGSGDSGSGDEPSGTPVVYQRFWVDPHEVTRADYAEVMGLLPTECGFMDFPQTDFEGNNRPADNITAEKAISFCNKLSVSKGYVPYYAEDGTESTVEGHKWGYRLLTYAEFIEQAQCGHSDRWYSGTDGSLPLNGNDSHQKVFTSDPVSYETDTQGNSIPVYDETSTFADAPENSNTNPQSTSIANIGDPELAKYAWTKYNIRTGEVETVPQPASYVEGWGQWKVFKYNGVYYKSNAYGYPSVRGDKDDNLYGTHAVGTRLPNENGLYDMTGNVSELVNWDGSFVAVGGDAACNTIKLRLTDSSWESKIIGFRICRDYEETVYE